MSSKLTIEQLFTPAHPAKGITYTPRDEETQLGNYLKEPGAQVLLFGETGVGKTSVAINACAGENWLRFQCEKETTFDEMIRWFSGQLLGRAPSRIEVSNERGFRAGFRGVEAHRAGQIRAMYEDPGQFSSRQFIELVTPEAWKLIIDDIERVGQVEVRHKIAQLAKSFSDQAPMVGFGDERSCAKIIAIGIAESMEDLLLGDPSTLGRVMSMHLRRLDDSKIQAILRVGFDYLGIKYSPAAIESFVILAGGYPRYAHALALEAGRLAQASHRLIDDEIVAMAVRKAIERYEANYGGLFYRATRSRSKSKRIHEKVLRAVANIRQVECSVEQVIEKVSQYDGALTLKSIRGPLGDLAKEKRGNVLRRAHNRKGLYKFSDALFKSFVRMKFYDIQGAPETS